MKYLLSWMGLFDIVGYFKIKNILKTVKIDF